ANRIAGAQGDAVKAARTLAGVGRPSANAGELVIWGAAPTETRVYVDWIPVPRAFHVGGLRSIVPTPMVEAVRVAPASVGPAYGRAIGGLVRVQTIGPRASDAPRGWGMVARADPLDVGAAADTRLGRRAWASVALRRSLVAQTYGPLLPPSARQVVPLPNYWDYQAKAVAHASTRDTVRMLALGSHDTVTRSIPSMLHERRFAETRTVGTHRFGAELSRARSDGSSFTASAWFGHDDITVAQTFPSVTAEQTQGAWRGGARLSEHRRVAKVLTVELGLDAEVTETAARHTGAITLPAREGDINVFGQPPGDRVGQDAWRTTQAGAAGYGVLHFELADGRWTLDPGLRLEPMLTVNDRVLPVRPVDPAVGGLDVELAVDPRLRVGFRPSKRVALYVAGGRYHQAAAPSDLSPVFGNPTLGAAQSHHAVAGVRAAIRTWMTLETAGFFTHARRLAVRSPEATPPIAGVLRAEGEGRNAGGQLAARWSSSPSWFVWLAYSLVRADRRRDGSAPWRPFDFDQRHIARLLGSWAHRTGVELGGQVAATSGNPRTPVVDAVANARTGDFDPVFGTHNSTRLPAFFSVAARVGYRATPHFGQLRAWLELTNATNHRNAEEVFYSADFSRRGFVRGLPILPSLGIEVKL
ncbi:MAG: TonB-dependent receptor, partial [Myxococcota bacterium]